MPRLPHRLVAFVLLLSTLLSLLPVASPSAAVTAAPLAVTAAPIPRIPRPTAASSGVPVSEVADLSDDYEDRHTAGTLDLSLFDHPRKVTYTAPPVTQEGAGQLTTRLTLPPGPHTSIELDISVTSLGDYQAGARVNVLDHIGTWQPSDPGELVATSAYGTGSTHIQLALGSTLDRSAPVQVELACFPYGYSTYPTRKTRCDWSNITVYAAVPGWVPTQAKPASRLLVSSVYDHAYASIPPRDGPFLLMESTNSGGGGPATHVHKIQSEQVRFPRVTGPIDLGFHWAKTLTGSGSSADGIQLLFRPADGSFPTTLVDTGVSGSTGWTAATKTLLTDSPEWKAISGKQGWLELRMVSTSIPRAVALDDISFSQNGVPLTLLPAISSPDQSVGKDPQCSAAQPQAIYGDPVNTFSGSLLLLAKDLTVPVPGPALCLRRTYVSLTANPAAFPTSPLGPGWRHSFAGALTFAHQPGGEKGTVIYEAPSGNRLRFTVLDSAGTYDPAPGVYAGLKRIGSTTSGTYTLTTRDRHIQRFNAQGQLIEQQDAQGRRQTLSYATDPGTARHNQLAEVRDQSTQRTLTFSYTFVGSQVRLTSVQDQAGRSMSYGYDPAGRLTRVTDVRGGVTTYTYDGTTALLASETDPLGVTRLRNTYTDGRVTQQVDATGLETRFTYTPTADGLVTTITSARAGVTVDQQIDHYRVDGTLRYQERDGQLLTYVTLDRELAPTTVVDGNGRATLLTRNESGDLTALVDAAGQTTAVVYNAHHQPTQVVGPDGVIRELAYDERGNLIRATVRAPDGPQLTTIATYTAENRLQSEQRPDGVVTRYSYDASGQLIRTIVNEQPDGYDPNQPDRHLVTEYGYDSVGRLITTTVGVGTPLQRTDTTSYNADDTIARTVQNYQDGMFNPSQPDEDIVTEYGYDVLGQRIFVKDVLGHYDVTRYAPNGQVAETIRNCRDALGLPVATGCTPFAPASPDRNVVTRYGYDELNRTTFITETGLLSGSFDPATRQFSSATERATHIEYDQISRPVTVTRNDQEGQPIYDPTIPSGSPDVNLQELTAYDGAGNVIWQRDALGRWTHTKYDALGRPVRTIANYDDGDPRTTPAWATSSDTDLITEQQYRPDGQLARQITNRITGQFSLNAPDADRITDYRYDLLGRPTATIQNVLAGSTRTDTNRTTTTAYDPQTGRVQGQQDALGQWLSYRYDDLSRVTATIQNCRDGNGAPHPSDCADTTKPSERKVRSLTRYDALGRVVETEDALGHVTRTDYDGLGRVVATIANFVSGAPADADTNVTTRTAYDPLGRVIAVTDPTGAVTQTAYDALGRAVAVTDAAGRVTRHGYDASGTLRWTERPDGRLTVVEVDGVGRVVTTIANYHNGSAEAADGSDRDVITTTKYDAAGRRIETTDAGGRRTAFRYDLRDQLIQVIENDHPECSTLPVEQQPCNVTTRYTYDRAGNRTAITDALNHTRTLVYDAADRQTEERDGLGRATSWEYNRLDQPTLKRDPRGSAYDVTSIYDELGRRTGMSAPQLDAPITEQYDALGRRTQLQDGSGTTSFQYDDLSRITAVQQPTGTVGYSYTARGERSELRYPSGATVAYDYTVDGQLAAVQEGATALAHYAYDGVGRLARVTRANGTLTTYAYDNLDRLFDLTTRAQGELRSRYQYTLDRAGLRTGVTETFPPSTSGQSVLLQPRAESSTVKHATARGLQQIAFVPNRGQTDGRVAFVARHQGGTLFLTPQGLTLSLPIAVPGQAQPLNYDPAGTDPGLPAAQRRRATPPPRTAVRVEWLRANPRPTLNPDQALPGTVNDLRGNTPATWRRNLPTYGGVTYAALYDGIDLRYDGTHGALKGTYTVAPGADPSQIRWRYAGAKDVRRTDAGDLQVTLPALADHAASTLREAAPVAWQDGPGGRTPVAVAYRVAQDGSVGFTLGTYDRSRTLTIDPTLTWSTTLSGSGSDAAWGVAVASDGTLVLAGAATSADFPQNLGVQPSGHHGGYDAFMTKLSADGSQVLWQTFLGGSGDDHGLGLALDAQHRPVVVGWTTSTNLPTTANAVQASFGGGLCGTATPQPCTDAFITRVAADGSTLEYSSYLGGSKNEVARRVALAPDGSAVLVGETASPAFPTTAGAWQTTPGDDVCTEQASCTDAFVTRIDLGAGAGAEALRWSTRLGGLGADSAWGVAVDGAGEVLVTGVTDSANLPTTANAYDRQFSGSSDAFVTKLSGDGTAARFSTYLGSTAADYGRAVAVDGQNHVYVTGWSYSSLFPTTPGTLQPAIAGESDAFVTKLRSDGTTLQWSTLVGGSDHDYSFGLAVDPDGTSTLAGWTYSSDLPTYRPLQAHHAGPSGGQDLLVATLRPDGSAAHLVSYLGSASQDSAYAVAGASSGSVRVAGVTTATRFPSGSGDPSGTNNAFVVALDGLTTPGGEPAVEQRTVSYRYDPLQRLTEATETPGTSARYAYDLVGNRTGVWTNGVPSPTVSYDAANQVVGWSYDAAGNLLSDGTRTLTYDALSRLRSATAHGTTTSYGYTGDGVLVRQSANSSATTYIQDLVAPLSQVLEVNRGGTTTTYRYGQERLAEVQGNTRTWFGTDALGSVRQTATDSGAVGAPIHYDPWGTPTRGTQPTFGFTGELQDAVSGLVHLRARWYLPNQGTFASRDPFAGFPTQPYSLHPYQYGYSNPVLFTDPSGQYARGNSSCWEFVGLAWGHCPPVTNGWTPTDVDRFRKQYNYPYQGPFERLPGVSRHSPAQADAYARAYTAFVANPSSYEPGSQTYTYAAIFAEDYLRTTILPDYLAEYLQAWECLQQKASTQGLTRDEQSYLYHLGGSLGLFLWGGDRLYGPHDDYGGGQAGQSRPPSILATVEKKLATIFKKNPTTAMRCNTCATQVARLLRKEGLDADIVRLVNSDSQAPMMLAKGQKIVGVTGFHEVVRVKTRDGDRYIDALVYEHSGVTMMSWDSYKHLWEYPDDIIPISSRLP